MHSHLHGLGFSQPHSCWISSTPKDFLRSFSPDPRAPEQQDLPTAALGTPFKAFIRFWNPNRDTHMRLQVLISPISPQTCWNRGCPIPGRVPGWAGWAWSSLGWGARCPCPDWDGFFPAQTPVGFHGGKVSSSACSPRSTGTFFQHCFAYSTEEKGLSPPFIPTPINPLNCPSSPISQSPRAPSSCFPISQSPLSN